MEGCQRANLHEGGDGRRLDDTLLGSVCSAIARTQEAPKVKVSVIPFPGLVHREVLPPRTIFLNRRFLRARACSRLCEAAGWSQSSIGDSPSARGSPPKRSTVRLTNPEGFG